MINSKLKIWNGRGWDSAWLGRERRLTGVEHWYGCAESKADLMRLFFQADPRVPMSLHEIKNYASEGCWGNTMEGITPERGIWVKRYNGQLDRLI
jgi:hypothetical protein